MCVYIERERTCINLFTHTICVYKYVSTSLGVVDTRILREYIRIRTHEEYIRINIYTRTK